MCVNTYVFPSLYYYFVPLLFTVLWAMKVVDPDWKV